MSSNQSVFISDVRGDLPAKPLAASIVSKEIRSVWPLVTVVVVNWNRAGEVIACVDSIRPNHYPQIEILVVDNGSSDDSLQRLGALRGIELLALASNRGPTEARNNAIEKAKGKYIFLLDSDALLPERGMHALVNRM